jgi:Rad3-related DNA helicase
MAVALPTQELAQWYAETATGNTEEITFAVERAHLAQITVDDECTGKHCPSYADCFYYRNRASLEGADVVITNHALLCLNEITGGALLPPCDLVVVDEAHKLADYARNALGAEFTLGQISKALHLAMGLADGELIDYAETHAIKFEGAINRYIASADSPQVGVHGEDAFSDGEALANVLTMIADQVFSADELPNDGEEKKLQKRADRIRRMADKVLLMALPTPAGFVRWIEPARGDDPMTLCAKPFDVSDFIGALAGVRTEDAPKLADHTRCARCARTLTADKVAVLEGKPYGPDCIHYVDVFGDAETMALADWLGIDRDAPAEVTHGSRAIVFCSATLAAPDMAHFLTTAGLPDAMQMVAASPFDYAENALLYVVDGAGLFKGALSLRRLLVADKNATMRDLVKDFSTQVTLNLTDAIEQIITIMTKYDLYFTAVLDTTGKLIGVVSIDDVMRQIAPKA